MLTDYQPLDYQKWIFGDQARKGANIKRLKILTQTELTVWNEAIPYQDQRNDPGQGEMVTYFAIKLLGLLKGDRRIVVPAAMLHDTGFYGGDPELWQKLVKAGKDTETEARRRPHQNRGCMIAGMVLQKAGRLKSQKDLASFLEIADIIGDHDTRRLPPSYNGQIVRDADILWRFTAPCIRTYWSNLPYQEKIKRLENSLYQEGRFYYEISRIIAKIEMVNSLKFLHPRMIKKIVRRYK